MNFILPIGDFIRKGGDVMLGDLVLEDARLFVIRDQTSLTDSNIVNRSKTVAGAVLSMEFQNELGVGVSNISSTRGGYLFLSPNDGESVSIPSNYYGDNVNLFNYIQGSNALAVHWWIIYSLIFK